MRKNPGPPPLRIRGGRGVLRYLAIFFLFLLQACARDLVTGRKTYNWFSLRDEIRMGRQVIDEQLKALAKKEKRSGGSSGKVDEEADLPMTKKIREITRRIA